MKPFPTLIEAAHWLRNHAAGSTSILALDQESRVYHFVFEPKSNWKLWFGGAWVHRFSRAA
jgi:hypothetical protein